MARGAGGQPLALLAVTVTAAAVGQYCLTVRPVPWVAAAAWVATAAAFALCARTAPLPSAAERVPPGREALAALAIFAVGAFFVTFRVAEFPAGLNHDAAIEGLYALRILDGAPYTPYVAEHWGRETFTFYLRAASIAWLGPTIRAVQAPSMVCGILSLPFFYGWVRELFGARSALLATGLLAVSGWHLVFSRVGWRSDFQPLFMAVTCFFFCRGMRTLRRRDFLLAGIALGLALNTYNAARAFPLLFVLWFAAAALQSPAPRRFLRPYADGLSMMVGVFAVVVAPLGAYALSNWHIFERRFTFLHANASLLANLRDTALLFNVRGNGNDFFVTEPGLEYPTAIVFVIGLLWAVRRWRDRRVQFVLIGLAVSLLPGLLTVPNLNRGVGAMIFVYALAGLGLTFCVEQIERSRPRHGLITGTVVAVGILGAAAVASYRQYLGPHRRLVWGFYPETTVLGQYVRNLVPRYVVWIAGGNFPVPTLTYLSYPGSGDPMEPLFVRSALELLDRQPAAPTGDMGVAFILANEEPARPVLATLSRRFPVHAIVQLSYPVDDGPVFATALLVPPLGRPLPSPAVH
jgi:hypothetical protein